LDEELNCKKMLNRNKWLLLVCCWIFLLMLASLQCVNAQKDTIVIGKKKEKSISMIILPGIGYSPANGFVVGGVGGATWFMGNKATTKMSNATVGVMYTTQNQVLCTLKGNTYFRDNSFMMLSDIRYLLTSQSTYGLGTGPQSAKPIGNGGTDFTSIQGAQMMEFDYLRFHSTLLKQFGTSGFYGGIGVHCDWHTNIHDTLLNIDADPPVYTSHYAYSQSKGFSATSYLLSGISVNAIYDSRDNAVSPYRGRYAYINMRVNPKFLGSDQNSSILWVEYRDYFSLYKERPRHIIGLWTSGWFVTSGNVPYLDLPAIGWDQFSRSGRGYVQGRFRGEDFAYGEVEYRFPLQQKKDTFGGVLFVNSFSASGRDAGIDLFEYVNFGYGVGFRIMLDKRARTNFVIDYGLGQYGSNGFYVTLNETF